MAKSQRKPGRTAKPKTSVSRADRNHARDQSAFEEPTDEFVTDAEIEARELRHPTSKSRKKGR